MSEFGATEHHHHRPGGTPVVFRCPNGCIHLVWGQTMLHFSAAEFRRLATAVVALVTDDATDLASRPN